MFALPLTVAVIMPLILTAFGTVSLVSAFSALFAYLLLGAACLAVGTWISALTENQIIAYLATFGALLIAYLMNGIKTMFTSGNLLALIVFLVVLLIAAVLVGVLCKSLPVGLGVFGAGAVVLVVLFQLRPAWLLSAFNAVLGALALFQPVQRRGRRHVQRVGHRVLSFGDRAVFVFDGAVAGTPPLALRGR